MIVLQQDPNVLNVAHKSSLFKAACKLDKYLFRVHFQRNDFVGNIVIIYTHPVSTANFSKLVKKGGISDKTMDWKECCGSWLIEGEWSQTFGKFWLPQSLTVAEAGWRRSLLLRIFRCRSNFQSSQKHHQQGATLKLFNVFAVWK